MNKQVFFLNFSCRQSLDWRPASQNGRINNTHYHIISHIPILPICPYCLSVYFVVCSDFLLPSAVRWERACARIPSIITPQISTIYSSFDTFDRSDTSNPIAVKILEENIYLTKYFKNKIKSGKHPSDVSNVKIPVWRAV